jgi:hypothetical protein
LAEERWGAPIVALGRLIANRVGVGGNLSESVISQRGLIRLATSAKNYSINLHLMKPDQRGGQIQICDYGRFGGVCCLFNL